jgi:hypothetical protein
MAAEVAADIDLAALRPLPGFRALLMALSAAEGGAA